MFGGVGGEIIMRDITQPWLFLQTIIGLNKRVQSKTFLRNYETFTATLILLGKHP